ncbi:hypothetical protein [Bacillus phage phiAGATE]|uniref:Uncharacterized protein n=1 Tax=Bacillus phage phiAGATE TaxID=1204533 RepID=L0LBX6_9CAUD|nr:hypothetical protein G380_gp005 [Bacillus phage phiAGATE]YP_008855204.1 hypothetical protein G380_gp168 [Bacillus phage phiAGATE]AGB62655.1 hypothetical protein [Bacillus phage phiAGATE]AHB12552.1 hypothetical protein [Bacillus phage phiAGATE]
MKTTNEVFEYEVGEKVKVNMDYEMMKEYGFTNDTLFTVHSREIEDEVHWYILESHDGELVEADGASIYK